MHRRVILYFISAVTNRTLKCIKTFEATSIGIFSFLVIHSRRPFYHQLDDSFVEKKKLVRKFRFNYFIYIRSQGRKIYYRTRLRSRIKLMRTSSSIVPRIASAPMQKVASTPFAEAPVRKEFPETWLWQTIGQKRLDVLNLSLLSYLVMFLFQYVYASENEMRHGLMFVLYELYLLCVSYYSSMPTQNDELKNCREINK